MRVIIAGGGTGGHLYPGIAIAKELLRKDQSSQILFVGTDQGIEKKVVPQEGFQLETVISEGIKGKSFTKRIRAVMKVPKSIMQSMSIVKRFKPDLIAGVGGYASFSSMIAGRILGIPGIIHEQNRIPGTTNKLLGKIANKIAVSFKESLPFFPPKKTVCTGNPVRPEFIHAIQEEKKKKEGFTLFVFGGSQGASSINRFMLDALSSLKDYGSSLHIIHQTGNKEYEQVEKGYKASGISFDLYPFITNIAECYLKADLVICRAGATSIAELTVCGKPSILIPYPFAVNNHQEENARVLTEYGAGIMMKEDSLSGVSLSKKIIECIENRAFLKEMSKKSRRLGKKDAAEKIVELCYEIAN